MSKTTRQALIRDLLARGPATSQDDLPRQLARRGIAADQPTISRDAHELGLVKTPAGYALPRREAPLRTTAQLASIVRRVVGRHGRIDPETRTFQAIRIWVNGELDGLDLFLRALCARLRAGARFAVVTFHSLEDRPVKHTFRALAGEGGAFRLMTKKSLVPGDGELRSEPACTERAASGH